MNVNVIQSCPTCFLCSQMNRAASLISIDQEDTNTQVIDEATQEGRKLVMEAYAD